MTAIFGIGRRSVLFLSLGLAGAALQAQSFNYQTRDLLLNFRKAGNPSDLEVNLGSVNQLLTLAPGSTVTFADRYSVSLQLLPTFGSVNGLSFSVIGTQRGAGDSPANTSWLTLKRADPEIQSTPPLLFTGSKTANIQSAISGIAGDGSTTGALPFAARATYPPSTATALIVPTTGLDAVNSYSVKYSAVGGLASLTGSPGVDNSTPANFSTTAGAVVRSDLYEFQPGVAGVPAGSQPEARYVGYFTFGNNGTLSFTAVPEPHEYALFGLGLLGLVAFHRINGSSNRRS
jgi:hypothetical protein